MIRPVTLALAFIVAFVSHIVCAAPDQKVIRDPFWPVGYEPPVMIEAAQPGEAVTTAVKVKQQWPDLPVRGISRAADGSYFALIDGSGVVRAGDDVSIKSEDVWFHWRVVGIEAKGLRTVRLGVSRSQYPPALSPPEKEAVKSSIEEKKP